MKIIIAPDKFKGSLTSKQACESIVSGIKQVTPGAEVFQFPMADGGDGFDEVMQYYLTTETVTCNTVDVLMKPMKAAYQWLADTKTAIISVAAASGLASLKKEERNPLLTSTYGTGLLVKDAVEKGANKIMLGLGGSATNDAGIGILAALGFQFKNSDNDLLKPTGGNLSLINKIIPPSSIPKIEFTIACDVENKLFGKNGAAFVYAAQKGADENAIIELDNGLKNIAAVLQSHTKRAIAEIKGTGAAGGIAASLLSYFDCKIESGAKLIIDSSGIESDLSNADLLITGEGKLDNQSGYGKVIYELSAVAKKSNLPVIALCGKVDVDRQQISRYGLASAYEIVSGDIDEITAIKDAPALLTKLAAFAIKDFQQEL